MHFQTIDSGDERLHHCNEALGLPRLAEDLDPLPRRGLPIVGGVETAGHQEGKLGSFGPDRVEKFPAILPRHHHVGDDENDLVPVGLPDLERFFTIGSIQNFEAGPLENSHSDPEDGGLVIDEEQSLWCVMHRAIS